MNDAIFLEENKQFLRNKFKYFHHEFIIIVER